MTADFTVVSGYEQAGDLLENYKGLDGLTCVSDTMAVEALRYLRDHGIRVHYSYEKCGEIAVQMLMEQLNQGGSAMKEVKLGCQIVDPEAGKKERCKG